MLLQDYSNVTNKWINNELYVCLHRLLKVIDIKFELDVNDVLQKILSGRRNFYNLQVVFIIYGSDHTQWHKRCLQI